MNRTTAMACRRTILRTIRNEDNGKGNSTYYQPSDGPQMFQLITEVPEPSSFALLGSAAAIVVFGTCVRCNRASRFRRSPAGQAWETVRR